MRDTRKIWAGLGALALAVALAGCSGGGSVTDAQGGGEATEQVADGSAQEGADVAATDDVPAEPEETGVWVLTARHSETSWSNDDESHVSASDATYDLDEQGNVLSSIETSTYDDYENDPYVRVFAYDEQGFVTGEWMVRDYEEGQALSPEEYKADAPNTKYAYELDDQGRPTKRSSLRRSDGGGGDSLTVWTYDEDGNKVYEESDAPDDAAEPAYEDAGYVTTYTYEAAGNIASITTCYTREGFNPYYGDDKQHTEVETSTYTYDEQGLLTSIETTTEHDDGVKETVSSKRTYELDESGRPLTTTVTNDEGAETVYTHTYDENGNLVATTCGEAGSSYYYEERFEWTYVEEPSLAVRLAMHLFGRGSFNW